MSREREVVRDLARKVAEIAHNDQQDHIRSLWARNNALEVVERPPLVVQAFCLDEIGITVKLVCETPWLREVEQDLRCHSITTRSWTTTG